MFFNTFTWALLFVFLAVGQRSCGLLFEGHMQFIDSYYMSVPLVEEYLQKKTFICGTVKINKKFLPPQAIQKQGHTASFENHSRVKFF